MLCYSLRVQVVKSGEVPQNFVRIVSGWRVLGTRECDYVMVVPCELRRCDVQQEVFW